MNLSSATEQLAQPVGLTADDLLGMSSPRGERYELIDGTLFIKEPPGFSHGCLEARLATILSNHCDARGLGRVLAGDAGFVTRSDERTVRAPDLAFVSFERLPRGPVTDGFGRVAPDLTVEILSPGDRRGEVEAKTREWLRFGVTAVWLVDPRQRRVRVVTRDGEVVVGEGERLLGGEAFSGFALPVADLFAD